MDPTFGEMLDGPPEARARYYEMIARLTIEERAKKVAALSRAARGHRRAGLRVPSRASSLRLSVS